MRLLITSDLHYNHRRSRPLADELIDRINKEAYDLLLVIGDTAPAESDALQVCLGRFTHPGPRLFVSGNHELWTDFSAPSYAVAQAADPTAHSHDLYTNYLPTKLREIGWHYLDTTPYITEKLAIVGSLGWYDFSFAQKSLGIPLRFYEQKISPGAAHYRERLDLFEITDDIAPSAMEIFARWNDGRFIKLGRSDEQFLGELLAQLKSQLDAIKDHPRIIAAIHHLPFAELLPPPRNAQWDFAKAYLGSEKIGQLLLRYRNITNVFCGHSHFPAQAQVGHIRAQSTGCGYNWKTYDILDITERD